MTWQNLAVGVLEEFTSRTFHVYALEGLAIYSSPVSHAPRGRPPALTPAQIAEARTLRASKVRKPSLASLAARYGVSMSCMHVTLRDAP